MKKVSIFLFTFFIASTAWADSADRLTGSAIEKSDNNSTTTYIMIDGEGNSTLDSTEEVYFDPPPNDDCEDAIAITGPYPNTVSGTLDGATLDCPGLLDWDAVWYTIQLPYSSQNVTVDWCETADDPEITNYGIVYMDDCACDDYVAGSYGWDCANGNLILSWSGVVGPTTIYLPLFIVGATDFTITVDVEDLDPGSVGDACINPLIVDSLPYQFFGTTYDNTDTYGNTAPDEWHLVTIDEAGPYMFTLCGGGTDYDSYIYLLQDDCATQIASNDDACGLVSEMEVNLDPGEYVFAVDGYSSNSGDYQLDIYSLEPPEYYNCQYPPHAPDDGWSAGTSHNNGDDVYYLRADRFGDAGVISGLTVAGLRLIYDGSWANCEEDPMTFELIFYEDGAMPGSEVCSYLLESNPVPTGELYAGYPLQEFVFYLPTPCELEQGWFSVQSVSDCWFLWMSAPEVDGISALNTGGGWGDYTHDLAWCLMLGGVTELETPASFALHTNYPNPFNPVTNISYDLATPEKVELDLFNISGERVATLVNEDQVAGEHTVQFDGSNLPSGVYFYRLTAGEFSQTNRMLLVK